MLEKIITRIIDGDTILAGCEYGLRLSIHQREEMGSAEAAQFISTFRGDGKTVLMDQDDR